MTGVRVSYLQARALPSGSGGAPVPIDRVGRVLAGMGWTARALGWAHDAQVMDAPLAARHRVEGGWVRLPASPAAAMLELPLAVEIVAWSFGFAALRLEVAVGRAADGAPDLGPHGAIARLAEEQFEWAAGSAVWHVPGLPYGELRGNARRMLDGIAFSIHERTMGRRPDPARFAEWTASKRAAFERSDRLQRRGELRFPYPTIGGVHVDTTVDADRFPAVAAAVASVREPPFERMHRIESGPHPAGVEILPIEGLLWRASNYVSIAVASGPRRSSVPDEAEVLLGLLETLTVRRSVRVCLARDMQASLGRRRSIRNATVADWLWLHAAAINDSIFGGPALRHLIALREQERDRSDLQDSMLAESQVRSTLQLLLDRVDAERDRVGIVSGLLFGVVATTSVASVTREFMAGETSGIALVPVLGAAAAIALIALLLLARSRRIRPPRMRPSLTRFPGFARRFLRA